MCKKMRYVYAYNIVLITFFIINPKINYLNGASVNINRTDLSVQRKIRQVNVDECIPPTIQNGIIKILKQKTLPKKNFLSINVTCDADYILQPSTDYLMSCFNGFWDVDETPKCIRCIKRTDVNENTNPELICPEIMKDNAAFTDCGQRIDKTHQPFVVNGKFSKFAEFPWHVGIYLKLQNIPHLLYHCGGSIINEISVLTVAHCLSDAYGKVVKSREYYAAAGKYHRNFNLDVTTQRRKIVAVNLHPQYKGELTNYAWDIAVVTVNEPFQLSILVHPVCIDWKTQFENEQLSPEKYGEVAGWGKSEVDFNAPSSELRVIRVPFIQPKKCNSLVPRTFIRYITPDKFCAGYTNGSSVCDGDSGGGLVFEREENGRTKYYIRGLVSVGVQAHGMCDEYKYSTYTKISDYIPFIRECVENRNISQTPYIEPTTIPYSSLPENFTDTSNRCMTPNNEEANCISVYDCKTFIHGLQNIPTPETIQFMKNSICGKRNEKKVCCGSKVNYLSVIHSNPVTGKPIEHRNLNLLPQPGVCGRRTQIREDRKDEENRVEFLDFPWMALLEYGTPENSAGYLCSGFLINERYVLTAAHCVVRTRISDSGGVFRVRLGENDLNTERDCVNLSKGTGALPNGRNCTDPPLDIDVSETFIHPSYRSRINGIALLRLARNVSYTDFIKPICLPLNGETSLPGRQMVVVRWNKPLDFHDFKNQTSKYKILLFAISNEDCVKKFLGEYEKNYKTNLFVCAKYEATGYCIGDSGAPLMGTLSDSEDFYAEGVVANSPGGCGGPSFVVSTRVTSYMDWILSVIEP